MNCLFCEIVKGTKECYKIYEDDYTIAFLDIFPNSKGHTLVIPKKHFKNILDCDDLYLNKVAIATKKVAKLLDKKLNPTGFNYVSNQGTDAFQMIFHYHIHIIPKYEREQGYQMISTLDKHAQKNLKYTQRTLIKKQFRNKI